MVHFDVVDHKMLQLMAELTIHALEASCGSFGHFRADDNVPGENFSVLDERVVSDFNFFGNILKYCGTWNLSIFSDFNTLHLQ